MKRRMRLPALNLLVGCGLGVVLGTVMHEQRPQIVLAKAAGPAQAPADGKLRIIIFGAHPDDAEYRGAGVAMKWARMGHHVKLVSATNGDIGHWQIAGGPLAQRRKKEVVEVGRRLGVTTEVLDILTGRSCRLSRTGASRTRLSR
jgi:N-acetylglucosamine malate deacetylase 1